MIRYTSDLLKIMSVFLTAFISKFLAAIMKKHVAFGVFASVVTIGGMMGATALAESISSGPGSPSSGSVSPMIINIGPSGRILMRGVVESSGADSITVKSWGGIWQVKVSSATEVISMNRAVSDFQAGDFMGVLGTIASDGSFVIDATIVREWGKKADHDRDGIADDQDQDDDNDGASDTTDLKPLDHDNDSISDDQDADDDNDGISDDKDAKVDDHDNDGISDSRDKDDDNDGKDDAEDDDRSGSSNTGSGN